jgi:hypothetical protein
MGAAVSGVDGPVFVETTECLVAVLEWRQAAGWFAAASRSLGRSDDHLALDGLLGPACGLLDETERQLGLTARLLELAVRAASSIGFDLGETALSGEAPSELVAVFRALRWSLDDPRGLRPVDLADPTALRGFDVTAHLGALPLWGPDGPLASDVHQGVLGDCSLLAVLASVAAADPTRIRDSIVDHGDGTYTVTIDGEAITVDDEFPVFADGAPLYARGDDRGTPDVLWPLLYEKAAATARGGDYDDIASWDPAWAHDLFGGTDDADVLVKLDEVLADGRVVTATSGDAFAKGGTHAWSVLATGVAAGGTPTVTVRNPWGHTGFTVTGRTVVNGRGEAIPDVDPDDVVIDEEGATVTIPLAVFTDQFDELDYVTEWD